MTITEFLTARLDEDEAVARDVLENGVVSWDEARQILYRAGWHAERAEAHIERHDPARVLADIAAKRAIMELAEEASGMDMQVDGEFRIGRRDTVREPYVGDLILRHLVQPYAGHEDYDEGWRP